jgi:HEAT repeat protein
MWLIPCCVLLPACAPSSSVERQPGTELSRVEQTRARPDPQLQDAMRALHSDSDDEALAAAIAVVARAGPEGSPAIPLLIRLAAEREHDDPIGPIATDAIRSLAPWSLGTLGRHLGADEHASYVAAEALVSLGADSVPVVVPLLNHRNPEVRLRALMVLG